MTEALSFLDRVMGIAGTDAHFIPRLPGIPLSRDKWETLERLEPAHRSAIEFMGYGWNDLWRAEQVHGADLAIVPSATAGDRFVQGVDGLLTSGAEGILLGVYVADCAAVYLCDRRTGALGLVHSGKQGTEREIVSQAVARMSAEFGTRSRDLEAAISPCIRPPCYEVDIEVTIVEQLLGAGVPRKQIKVSGICTGQRVQHYYSYRVEKGKTGRMLALLGRKKEAPKIR
ncbi:MAG: hypothetical protein CMO40_06525 [Verrucomicrobiaceae bacterium]|nr:hypothetical protein [Verrucomicrobiaceae bacterium]